MFPRVLDAEAERARTAHATPTLISPKKNGPKTVVEIIDATWYTNDYVLEAAAPSWLFENPTLHNGTSRATRRLRAYVRYEDTRPKAFCPFLEF